MATAELTRAKPLSETMPQAADQLNFQREMRHISRQSSVFFLGTVFTAASGYLFKIYLARKLGAEALGIYALGMTVVGLAGVVAAAGIPQAASRFVAVYAGTGQLGKLGALLRRSVSTLLVLNLVVGLALLPIRRLLADKLYHTPAIAPYMEFFVAIMVLGGLNTFLGQCLAGYKDVARRTAITNFVGTPATMVLTAALLTVGYGLRGYLLAQVLGACLVLALLARSIWKLTPAQVLWSRPQGLGSEVWTFSAAMLAVQLLEFVLAQSDRVFLGIYLDAREVGIYSLASALIAFVPIVLQSVNQIFAPTIAELHALGDRALLLRLYQTLTKWSLGLTIPLAFTIMVFAKPLMEIFGAEFTAGWSVLVIGATGQLVNCGVGSVGLLLLMSGQQFRAMRIQALVALVTIVANLLLIRVLGITGAALASATGNILINVLYLRQVRKSLQFVPSIRSYITLAVPAAGTLAALLGTRWGLSAFPRQWVSCGTALLVAYLVFIALALATGLEAEDRLLAQDAWDRLQPLLKWRPV